MIRVSQVIPIFICVLSFVHMTGVVQLELHYEAYDAYVIIISNVFKSF